MYPIEWKGDRCDKYYPNRNGYSPFAICNHVTAGTAGSVYNWFTSPHNKQASSTFVVTRKGEIHQYVDIKHGAWTQGLTPDAYARATAPIVKEMGVNPNFYMVSIEHEGYVEGYEDENGHVHIDHYGLDGDLTNEQFFASLWLHKFIQSEIERLYNVRMSLNSHNVVGHFQVDPVRKPFCPGSKFPWTRLYSELAIADQMSMDEFEERMEYRMNEDNDQKKAYELTHRVNDLYNKVKAGGQWSKEAERKLLIVYGVLEEKGWM